MGRKGTICTIGRYLSHRYYTSKFVLNFVIAVNTELVNENDKIVELLIFHSTFLKYSCQLSLTSFSTKNVVCVFVFVFSRSIKGHIKSAFVFCVECQKKCVSVGKTFFCYFFFRFKDFKDM